MPCLDSQIKALQLSLSIFWVKHYLMEKILIEYLTITYREIVLELMLLVLFLKVNQILFKIITTPSLEMILMVLPLMEFK